nr:oxygen-dependent coproporphyrinogen-III oxidase, chloroplastic-like [Arachis hypogaea]
MAHYSSSSSSVRARFEKMIREAQDPVCTALDATDGWANFKEDVWSRPGGGGGISRVLQDKAIWKNAGVKVSVIYGIMPPEAYRAAKAAASPNQKPGPIPFFTAGISSVSVSPIQFFSISYGMGNDINLFQVLYPKNPFAPTLQIMIFHPYFGVVSHTIITTVVCHIAQNLTYPNF